jgi:voltage-gated sodium channel
VTPSWPFSPCRELTGTGIASCGTAETTILARTPVPADDPEHFGSLGRAVLTLFLLMTLDGLGDAVRAGLEISRWSVLYYASYVLLASFVLVNVLIGVVINSLDEAREIENVPPRRPPRDTSPRASTENTAQLRQRIAAARHALDELENSLTRTGAHRPVPVEGTAPTAGGDT